jgi:hypothetical protein
VLDQVRELLRIKHYALRTGEAYINWIKRFAFFHHKRHPREMGTPDIRAFFADLPPLLRNPSAEIRVRYRHGAGALGAK